MFSLRTTGGDRSRQAFSIAEILIVLAIFSAMVGVFVTGFGSLQGGFSHTLALHEEVQRAIRLARNEAGKSQMSVFIWYPADHSSIGITRDNGEVVKIKVKTTDGDKELDKIELPDKISFQFLDAKDNRELASICVDPSGVLTPFRLAYRAENRAFQTYKADIFSGHLALLK
ncbi:MAG: type II secretion system GspH family protein [Puniceicoccales bacterium]|jgi:Tfp pilus assembly protein FimT|nr:type II secretion system GspH family protein [Puniceicoccales bacterium]